MEKNYLSPNIQTKEKEYALSLFRISIDFFSDNNNISSKTSSTSSGDNINMSNKTTPISTENSQKVKLNPNGSTSISTDFNFEQPSSGNIAVSSEETTSNTNPTPLDTTSQPEASAFASSEANTNQSPNSTSSDSKTATSSSTNTSHPKTAPSQNNNQKSSSSSSDSKTSQTPKPENGDKKPSDNSTKPKDDNKSKDNDNSNKDETPSNNENTPDNKKVPNDNSEKESSPDNNNLQNKPKDSKLQNELDRLNDKYLKPRQKNNKNQDKNNLPDKANNLTKALPGKANNIKNTLNKAQKYAGIAKEIADDPGEAAKITGDAAVKAASLAASAINPAVGKAINVADKVLGETEVGKKSKKAIGCCVGGCCAGGCLLPIIAIFFVFFYLISAFSWALKWFGVEEDFVEMDFEEYKRIQEASHADFSLENLINEIQLGENKLYSIEDIFTAVISNKDPQNLTDDKSTYSYLKDDVDKYNSENADLIEEGKLVSLTEGDLTSFGQIFELSFDNYTVNNLKLPALAAQSNKDNNVYTTSDLDGKHQALFEDVLNNMETTINRFNGQVRREWFEENLINVLDQKFDVYIHSMNETRSLSLRDLFQETSKGAHDTEYDRYIVSEVFSDVNNNTEIIAQFKTLQKNLASLEMMNYMLYYQKFYFAKLNLRNSDDFKDCVNINMFSDEFFAQFLTFTDISQLITFASLTDHSLVYEIVNADLEMGLLKATTDDETKGGLKFGKLYKYTNWYATYVFEPEVIVNNGSYSLSMPCVSVDKTNIQQTLFDKYNVEANYRYGSGPNKVIEKTPEENASTFFSIFELATGIPMSVGDDGVNVPQYDISSDGVVVPNFTPIQAPSGASARITLPFGASYSDTTVAAFGVDRTHKGIDYGVPTGTTVYATASGTAYTTYGNTGYGNYTKIIHDDGYTSIYAHGNGTFYVTNGSRVSAGQPIMQSGNSGNSTGPHLHFEVRNKSGTPINPTHYIYS